MKQKATRSLKTTQYNLGSVTLLPNRHAYSEYPPTVIQNKPTVARSKLKERENTQARKCEYAVLRNELRCASLLLAMHILRVEVVEVKAYGRSSPLPKASDEVLIG